MGCPSVERKKVPKMPEEPSSLVWFLSLIAAQVRLPAAGKRSEGSKKQAELLTCFNDYEDSVYREAEG